mmetsp:Transcript_104075/g.323600  ORF Transcript_104075/g.323600 Transcript_104075/m.323600 type:complete len:266 (-) Transcript_104075:579-1376(-)
MSQNGLGSGSGAAPPGLPPWPPPAGRSTLQASIRTSSLASVRPSLFLSISTRSMKRYATRQPPPMGGRGCACSLLDLRVAGVAGILDGRKASAEEDSLGRTTLGRCAGCDAGRPLSSPISSSPEPAELAEPVASFCTATRLQPASSLLVAARPVQTWYIDLRPESTAVRFCRCWPSSRLLRWPMPQSARSTGMSTCERRIMSCSTKKRATSVARRSTSGRKASRAWRMEDSATLTSSMVAFTDILPSRRLRSASPSGPLEPCRAA